MSGALLTTIAGFALVLLLVAGIPVLAARLRLPIASVQAALGIALGVAILIAAGPLPPAPVEGAPAALVSALRAVIDALSALGAQGVLALFLPPLLFDASLRVDTRRLLADLAPVLLLAVVAVLLTTALVTAGLVAVTAMPLLWAVLLGALVATTDPSAVLGAFREVGAPRRLQALVEGESLLNDAAAIVLFVVVAEVMRSGIAPTAPGVAGLFAWSFLGGAALGAVLGHAAGLLVARLRAYGESVTTVSLAVPYVAFVLAELWLGVSGVVAVVLAGLMLGRALEAKLPPAVETQVLALWGQLATWAGALIVIGATLLIPLTVSLADMNLWALVVVVVSCVGARVLVLYGMLPLLSRLRLGQPIDRRYRLAMLWGGLRGAVTVALALTVATEPELAGGEASQVAVLACGFVLVTLFIQAPTLPLLLRWLDLAGISPLDRVLMTQAQKVVGRRMGERGAGLRASLGLDVADVDELARPNADAPQVVANRSERILAALASLTEREADLYREFHDTGVIGRRAAPALLRGPRQLGETLRTSGLAAYAAATKQELVYDRSLRLCQWFYRRLGWRGPLARALAQRFELMLVRRAALLRLRRDMTDELEALFEEDAATRVDTLLRARLEGHQKAIEGLRVQYPSFANALETRFLTRAMLRLEADAYRELRSSGLISGAAFADLAGGLARRGRQTQQLPKLDLRIDRAALLEQVPLVATLDRRTKRRLKRALRGGLAMPGDRLIRRGSPGDSMYFIVDGAVQAQWLGGRTTLGSGDVFGEIALLTGARRTADVVALTHVRYLTLGRDDFLRITGSQTAFREALAALAMERKRELEDAEAVSRETVTEG